MSAISCRLLYQSTSPHLQQLYTGFRMLHGSGFIRLSQCLRRAASVYASDAPHLRGAGHAHLDAVLDGKIRLHFDTHDALEIATAELDACDFYFKRSYSPSFVEALPANHRSKVWPLGLNYRVLPDVVDFFALRRGVTLGGFSKSTLSSLKQALDVHNRLGFQPRLGKLESPLTPHIEPRVLFLVAAYDPHDDPNRSQDKIEDRVSINDMRARCIRLLRETLGSRFVGGFVRNQFTLDRYGELVVNTEVTSQEHYLTELPSYPICIATTGLHGSVGWKVAEYVAFSRAILSEPLVYRVPGGFERDRNYLEFISPEECLRAAVRLIEDASLRHELMRNNAAYYPAYLRPDALIRNALTTALQHWNG